MEAAAGLPGDERRQRGEHRRGVGGDDQQLDRSVGRVVPAGRLATEVEVEGGAVEDGVEVTAGEALLALPGGCDIPAREADLHPEAARHAERRGRGVVAYRRQRQQHQAVVAHDERGAEGAGRPLDHAAVGLGVVAEAPRPGLLAVALGERQLGRVESRREAAGGEVDGDPLEDLDVDRGHRADRDLDEAAHYRQLRRTRLADRREAGDVDGGEAAGLRLDGGQAHPRQSDLELDPVVGRAHEVDADRLACLAGEGNPHLGWRDRRDQHQGHDHEGE